MACANQWQARPPDAGGGQASSRAWAAPCRVARDTCDREEWSACRWRAGSLPSSHAPVGISCRRRATRCVRPLGFPPEPTRLPLRGTWVKTERPAQAHSRGVRGKAPRKEKIRQESSFPSLAKGYGSRPTVRWALVFSPPSRGRSEEKKAKRRRRCPWVLVVWVSTRTGLANRA